MATYPTVQIFKSSDKGAPVLSGTTGSLINLLDACLVNGYNSRPIYSITSSNHVATCTIDDNAGNNTNTTVLVHAEGANNSISIMDSINNVEMYRYGTGNSVISTTKSKWGSSSVYSPTVNDTLMVPMQNSVPGGTGSFFMEVWMYPAGVSGGTVGSPVSNTVFSQGGVNGTWVSGSWMLQYSPTGDSKFGLAIYGVSTVYSSLTYAPNNWYHIAVSKTTGGAWAVWINGSLAITLSNATTLTGYPVNWGGGVGAAAGAYYDEFRLIVNDNVYTSANSTISVPSGPYSNYSPDTTLATGQYVLISGCDQAEYNGLQGPITVTNSYNGTFTFPISGTPVSPATGSPRYARAPIQGWSKPYSLNNIGVYRSNDLSSNRFYLKITDTGGTDGGAKEAAATGYESMTDAFSGKGPFPNTPKILGSSSNGIIGVCWPKTSASSGVVGSWILIGDGKTFYLQTGSWLGTVMMGFGHFISNKPGDQFNTFLASGISVFNGDYTSLAGLGNTIGWYWATNNTTNYPGTGNSTCMIIMPRSYTQIGSTVFGILLHPTINNRPNYDTNNANWLTFRDAVGPPYPSPVDGGYYMVDATFCELPASSVLIRGRLPGFYPTGHAGLWVGNNADEFVGTGSLAGRTIVHLHASGRSNNNAGNWWTGSVFVDRTGPWT